MKRARISHGVVATVLGLALSAMFIGACGDEREPFDGQQTFETDGSVDAASCSRKCSLDGRSVIDTCFGSVIETCPPDLACGAGACQEPCAAATADRSSDGCEFYFQMPRLQPRVVQSCYAAFVVNTSIQPVDISADFRGQSLDISKATYRTNPGDATLTPHEGPVAPGQSVVVFVSDWDPTLPRSLMDEAFHVECPHGVVPAIAEDLPLRSTGIGPTFRLKTTVPVSVTTIYPFGGAKSFIPSATLLLPVSTWAKEHVVINAWESGFHGHPAVQILASEDGTDVTILPKRDIQEGEGVTGGPAGVPASYRLDRGQVLQLVQPEELTGSILTSTKPTSLVGANSCPFIPTNVDACDITAQQIPAFEQWGSEYVGVGYRPRLGNEHEPVPYRIVAARDGTLLDYDPEVPPGAPTTMSAGETATFYSGTGDPFVVRTQDAEHPVYLAAYMTGGGGTPTTSMGGFGDPEFVNVVATGQYRNSYSFYADPSYAETSLVIVRKKTGDAFKDVWLECAGNLTDWKPIGTRGVYEYRRVDLSRGKEPGDTFGESVCQYGLQRMKSEGPFTATIWGWDVFASYAYPGGMAQRKLVETPLAPVR